MSNDDTIIGPVPSGYRGVPGAPKYCVSRHGRVKRWNCKTGWQSLANKILPNRVAYVKKVTGSLFRLFDTSKVRLSWVVLAAWIEPRPSKSHIAIHLDGDVENCSDSNLRWAERPADAWEKHLFYDIKSSGGYIWPKGQCPAHVKSYLEKRRGQEKQDDQIKAA